MRRLVIALAVVVVAVGALAWGGVRVYDTYLKQNTAQCVYGNFDTDNDQASIAATMVGVVVTRGLPERAAVLIVAAALQESKLRNIPSGQGDRDSVGVLQQRPSQGWGTAAQLADVRFAAGAFLDRLVEITGWQTLPLPRAIQEVQISADEAAYAKHELAAQAIADGLTGAVPRGVTCSFAAPTVVAPAATVIAALRSALPVSPPTAVGKQIRVPGASWATAAWFVANGNRLGVDSVAYSGWRWSRSGGWQNDPGATAAAVIATMH